MPTQHTLSTLAILALCACGQPTQLASLGATGVKIDAAQSGVHNEDHGDSQLITASAMGHIRLGMTLNEARRALPAASFSRTSDGDGAALVEIIFGKDNSLSLWADEDDPATPIDWYKRIVTIEAFSAAFHTREGIHPGSLVTQVARSFGPVREIVKSEIEDREFVTFARQPRWLTFRLDYTGVFSPGSRETIHFAPGAKIWSISISSIH